MHWSSKICIETKRVYQSSQKVLWINTLFQNHAISLWMTKMLHWIRISLQSIGHSQLKRKQLNTTKKSCTILSLVNEKPRSHLYTEELPTYRSNINYIIDSTSIILTVFFQLQFSVVVDFLKEWSIEIFTG